MCFFKSVVALLFLLLVYNPLIAQKGNNHIAIGLEAGPVMGFVSEEFPYQLGLPVKVYLGTGQYSQWMLRSGMHLLPVSSKKFHESTRSLYRYIIPLALGYRRNLKNWYAEGSLGVGWNSFVYVPTDTEIQGIRWTKREINYGIEFGYQMDKFDFGVSLNNNGPIPYNIWFLGLRGTYKIGF